MFLIGNGILLAVGTALASMEQTQNAPRASVETLAGLIFISGLALLGYRLSSLPF